MANPVKFNFRANREVEEWLRSHDNMAKVIRDALDAYIANEDWRKSDNLELKRLINETRQISDEVNQIAKAVNTAECLGQNAVDVIDFDKVASLAKRIAQIRPKFDRLYDA